MSSVPDCCRYFRCIGLFLVVCSWYAFAGNLYAQPVPHPKAGLVPHNQSLQEAQREAANYHAVMKVVTGMFDAMRANDSMMIKPLFMPEAQLRAAIERKGEIILHNTPASRFITAVGMPHKKVWDERIYEVEVRIDEPLATVWAPYSFYFGDTIHHCGTNMFDLVKTNTGWKIFHLSDTRKEEDCPEAPLKFLDRSETINALLDDWHKAAATADENAFYGAMSEDGIYIGTDPGELWLRDELRSWAKKAFEKESAWDFKPIKRNVYFSVDGKVAWFDELLDTWMGTCRGSGVMESRDGNWELVHYHLSVTVLNEHIKEFLRIGKDKETQEK